MRSCPYQAARVVVTWLNKAREAEEKKKKAEAEGLALGGGGGDDVRGDAAGSVEDDDDDQDEFVYDIQVRRLDMFRGKNAHLTFPDATCTGWAVSSHIVLL